MLRPTYPIETVRLRLRPFRMDDLDALYAIQSRPDVMRYLYGEPRSWAEVRDVLATRAQHPTIEKEGDWLFLALERRDCGAVIGDVSLRWLSAEHKQGEIGFVLHPDHHGQGYGREAAVEMLRLGFAGLGLHRIIRAVRRAQRRVGAADGAPADAARGSLPPERVLQRRVGRRVRLRYARHRVGGERPLMMIVANRNGVRYLHPGPT